MKYIVLLTEDTTISTKLPVAGVMDAVEATRPYLDELKKRERVTDWGFYGAGHGLFAVINVKSHAELHEIVELIPARQFCALEINPVLESGEFADVFGKIKREVLANNERWTKGSSRSTY